MNKSKKRQLNMMVKLALVLVVIASVQPNVVYGAESIGYREAKPGFLQLNQKTRIYNKKGQN